MQIYTYLILTPCFIMCKFSYFAFFQTDTFDFTAYLAKIW